MAKKDTKVEDNEVLETVPETALAVVGANTREALAQVFEDANLNLPMYTSLDPHVKEERILLGKAMNQADMRAAQFMDKPFPVANVLIHLVPLPVEDKDGELTGEVNMQPRTVLIGAKGETAQFVSQGLARSLRNIFALWGQPPWNPPLNLKLRQIETKKGRTYNLEVVE